MRTCECQLSGQFLSRLFNVAGPESAHRRGDFGQLPSVRSTDRLGALPRDSASRRSGPWRGVTNPTIDFVPSFGFVAILDLGRNTRSDLNGCYPPSVRVAMGDSNNSGVSRNLQSSRTVGYRLPILNHHSDNPRKSVPRVGSSSARRWARTQCALSGTSRNLGRSPPQSEQGSGT